MPIYTLKLYILCIFLHINPGIKDFSSYFSKSSFDIIIYYSKVPQNRL